MQVLATTLEKYREQYASGDLAWEIDCDDVLLDYWTFIVSVREYESDDEYAARKNRIAKEMESTRERDLELLEMYAERFNMKVVPKE